MAASISAAQSENLDYFAQRSSPAPSAAKVERVFPIRVSGHSSQRVRKTSKSTASAPGDASLRAPAVPYVSTGVGALTPPNLSPGSDAPPLVAAASFAEALASGKLYSTKTIDYRLSGAEDSLMTVDGQRIHRCEDEPIHIPGAIQSFGALIGIQENEKGLFLVRTASENSYSVVGFEPDALFELRCFTDILAHAERQEFMIRIRALRVSDSSTHHDVFTISLTSLLGAPIPLFCAMHRDAGSDMIICEFELERDIFNPPHPADHHPHIIEKPFIEANGQVSERYSREPLHSLNIARKFERQLKSMELFSMFSEIQGQLSSAPDLSTLLDTTVGLVYHLTGFHRVMVYQFDEDSSGFVRSELVDLKTSSVTYKGLHFPAADIPKQARELYIVNQIRILYDTEQETARLVCRSAEDARTPLNLKHSYLRAMSPIHIKYLGNMGVRASMSISLMVGGKLWGLISCHNHGSSMRVSLPVREICRGLGTIVSINIEKLIYSSQVQARKKLTPGNSTGSPSRYISASSSDLLSMFGADFGFLVIRDEARTIGKLIAYAESITLLNYVRKKAYNSVFSSHNIATDVKDIFYEPGFSIISGMLVIPFAFSGADFLVFFRRGRLKEVNWAGNPNEKIVRPGSSYLEPRSSFQRWSESVVGTSREWTEDQVESATILSTLYGRFIEVWRQKEATVHKNRMTRLLIQNAGHELRTPLNSVINYLEVALEDNLDEQARAHLQKSLQASKSLVFVVNDLLNLTEAEDVEFNIHEDDVDLRVMLGEVISAFEAESVKRNIHVHLEADAFSPWIVRSDPTGLRQVVSNLLANAIQYSDYGPVHVRMEDVGADEVSRTIEISFEDEGCGLSEQNLNNIFQSFERILDDDANSPTAEPLGSALGSEAKPLQIGLGLAFTARFVRLNNGQVKMSSDGEGKGTKVSITIPFRKILQERFAKRELPLKIPLPTPCDDLDMGCLQTDSIPPQFSTFAGPEISLKDVEPDTIKSSNALSPSSEALLTLSNPNLTIGASHPRPSVKPLEHRLAILVAEDNPLNSRLLETRLRKRGHDVTVAVNGQDCFNVFSKRQKTFDAILMDMQMPFIDGTEATRLIRTAEENGQPSGSQKELGRERIPIIAVSASLKEHARHEYASAGFDGWILKPIDFQRLESILAAAKDEFLRKELTYAGGRWSMGGWLGKMDG